MDFTLSLLYVHHCGNCICGELVFQTKEGWSALTLAAQRGDDGILQDVLHSAGRLFDEVSDHRIRWALFHHKVNVHYPMILKLVSMCVYMHIGVCISVYRMCSVEYQGLPLGLTPR